MKLVINTDGLSKNNPGQAAIGAVLKDSTGKVVSRISKSIGIASNNVAEYRAIITALDAARKLGADEIELRSDSELVVKQLNGRYKVKSTDLRPLYLDSARLLNGFKKVALIHIPREQNKEADRLANQALKVKRKNLIQPVD
jgi:ribonuclease HI